jgi:hypothetical protein
MPTCPQCKHKWSTAKRSKAALEYTNYLVTFADNVFLVVGGYAASESALLDKAITRRALALSGGRFLDRSRIADVPAPLKLQKLDSDSLPEWRQRAQDMRKTWGACLDIAPRPETLY